MSATYSSTIYRALAEANARGQPQRELTRWFTTKLDPLYVLDSARRRRRARDILTLNHTNLRPH